MANFIKVYSPQSVIEHIIVESTKKLQFMANFSFFYFYFVPKKPTVSFESTFFAILFATRWLFCFILMGVRSFWRHHQKKIYHQRLSVATVCIQSLKQFCFSSASNNSSLHFFSSHTHSNCAR